MRLTTVAQMTLPPGRVRTLRVLAEVDPDRALPVSFDQRRHVGEGDRPGSWMALAFRLPEQVAASELAQAWQRVIAQHGTLATVFRPEGDEILLAEAAVRLAGWDEHPAAPDGDARTVVRAAFDAACRPFGAPSHRLCLVDPAPGAADPRPVVLIGSDHAHVDMWSLLVLLRDLLSCIEDLHAGEPAGARLRPVPDFAEHTAMLAEAPRPPEAVRARWGEILAAEGGVMPRFPLPLGEVTTPRPAVVEVRDVFDSVELAEFEQAAARAGTRIIALALAEMTRITTELSNRPLRAVFPVHSRAEPRWHDAVGWFITNAVLECTDPDPRACAAAVKEALRLGSYPLDQIFEDGMPAAPGMFALSWLDARRMPVAVDPGLDVQYVSAVLDTDGVMVWFIVTDDGLHLRCRYPDTPEARRHVGDWLDRVQSALQERSEPVPADADSLTE